MPISTRLFVACCLASVTALAPARSVVVTGATGRTGRLVVSQLVKRGYGVKAIVRDATKAKYVLPASPLVDVVVCDLASPASAEVLKTAIAGDVIWAATGFYEDGQSLDVKGIADLREAAPSAMVVMLSSAGVTRTVWPEEKKQLLAGAADIPIIRLNPGGILDEKRKAEDALRSHEGPYCVVRPTGLKFEDWPRGRPVLSQGDVAVGRTNPTDLAELLVACLDEPAARGKTFEMFTLTGYPAPRNLGAALGALQPDSSDVDEASVLATYRALQQLLPGEEQDATKLEMGRSYEQVDSGEVAARTSGAAPTQREKDMAGAVSASSPAGESPKAWVERVFNVKL